MNGYTINGYYIYESYDEVGQLILVAETEESGADVVAHTMLVGSDVPAAWDAMRDWCNGIAW